MKKHYLLLLIGLFSYSFYGQTKLQVLDVFTKKPIVGVHVKVDDLVYFTNLKGITSLNIKSTKKHKEITLTHVNYQTKTIKYKIKFNSINRVYLKEQQQELDLVVVSSKKNRQSEIKYKKLPSLPKPIHSFASILKKDKLFVFGGDASKLRDELKEGLSELVFSNMEETMKFISKPKIKNFLYYLGDLQVYDFKTNDWSRKENIFRKKAYHNVISYENKFYLLGGKRLSRTKSREYLEDKIEVYNTLNKSIEIDNTNPHQAVNFESLLYENKIFLIGGSIKKSENGNKKYSNKIHFYDLKSGYWYLLTKMTKGKETKGIIVKDKIYLFGGFKNKNLAEIETFSFKKGKWKTVGNLFKGMKNPAITKNKSTIYLFENSRLVTYNINSGMLKEYLIDLSFLSSKMHFLNDKLFIVGGYLSSEFNKVPINGFYSIDIKEFEITKPLNTKEL